MEEEEAYEKRRRRSRRRKGRGEVELFHNLQGYRQKRQYPCDFASTGPVEKVGYHLSQVKM